MGLQLGLGAQSLYFYVLKKVDFGCQSCCAAVVGQVFNEEGISSCLFLDCCTFCGQRLSLRDLNIYIGIYIYIYVVETHLRLYTVIDGTIYSWKTQLSCYFNVFVFCDRSYVQIAVEKEHSSRLCLDTLLTKQSFLKKYIFNVTIYHHSCSYTILSPDQRLRVTQTSQALLEFCCRHCVPFLESSGTIDRHPCHWALSLTVALDEINSFSKVSKFSLLLLT